MSSSNLLKNIKIQLTGVLLLVSLQTFAANKNTKIDPALESNKFKGISTATFSSLSFHPQRTAPAKVEAMNLSKIPAEISAIIVSIEIKPGSIVSQGDILAKLDCGDNQFRLTASSSLFEQTKQQLKFESKELKRAIKVATNSSLSKSEVERRQTTVNNLEFSIDSNKAAMEIAQRNVQRCNIVSPFAGLVSQRIANVGEMMTPGSAVVEIVQLHNLEVSATISISNISSFEMAESYSFVTNQHIFPIKLRAVFDYIANNSGSQQARFEFIDNSATIGSTGLLKWKSPELHLPAYLLSKRDGKIGVFIEQAGIANFIEVEIAEEGRPFSIQLDSDDKVILDGRHQLTADQKLAPVNSITQQKD